MNIHLLATMRAMRAARDTKERIERTAMRLFVERGVAETTVRDIAEAAGVSQGAMYTHYPSKDDLAWDLFAANWSEMGQELRQLTQERDGLEDKLRAMVRYTFDRFDSDWVVVSYVLLTRHMHLKEMYSRKAPGRGGNPYKAVRVHPYMVLHHVIADAVRHEEIPEQDPDVAASLVLGAIVQVIDTKILGRIGRKLSTLSDDVTTRCLCLLQAQAS